jgi:hypothetical protein
LFFFFLLWWVYSNDTFNAKLEFFIQTVLKHQDEVLMQNLLQISKTIQRAASVCTPVPRLVLGRTFICRHGHTDCLGHHGLRSQIHLKKTRTSLWNLSESLKNLKGSFQSKSFRTFLKVIQQISYKSCAHKIVIQMLFPNHFVCVLYHLLQKPQARSKIWVSVTFLISHFRMLIDYRSLSDFQQLAPTSPSSGDLLFVFRRRSEWFTKIYHKHWEEYSIFTKE